MYAYHTHLFALSGQVVDSFASSLSSRTHEDNDALSIFSTIIVEEAILATGNLRNLIHVLFYDSRYVFVV